MSRSGAISLTIAALVLASTAPALGASRIPGSGGLPALPNNQLQMQRQMMSSPKPVHPYPMNYAEHIAQSLGIRDGGVALYDARESVRDPYTPSVSLGGIMIRLRWRQ